MIPRRSSLYSFDQKWSATDLSSRRHFSTWAENLSLMSHRVYIKATFIISRSLSDSSQVFVHLKGCFDWLIRVYLHRRDRRGPFLRWSSNALNEAIKRCLFDSFKALCRVFHRRSAGVNSLCFGGINAILWLSWKYTILATIIGTRTMLVRGLWCGICIIFLFIIKN